MIGNIYCGSSGSSITPTSLGYVGVPKYFWDGIYNFGSQHLIQGETWLDLINFRPAVRKSPGYNFDSGYDTNHYLKNSGSGDAFLMSGDFSTDDTFSVELLISIESSGGTGENDMLNNYDRAGYGVYTQDNKIYASIFDSTTNSYKELHYDNYVEKSIYLITLTFDGSNFSLYVNKTLVGTVEVSSYKKSTRQMTIGALTGGTIYSNGSYSIYRIAYHTSALTLEQVKNNFSLDCVRYERRVYFEASQPKTKGAPFTKAGIIIQVSPEDYADTSKKYRVDAYKVEPYMLSNTDTIPSLSSAGFAVYNYKAHTPYYSEGGTVSQISQAMAGSEYRCVTSYAGVTYERVDNNNFNISSYLSVIYLNRTDGGKPSWEYKLLDSGEGTFVHAIPSIPENKYSQVIWCLYPYTTDLTSQGFYIKVVEGRTYLFMTPVSVSEYVEEYQSAVDDVARNAAITKFITKISTSVNSGIVNFIGNDSLFVPLSTSEYWNLISYELELPGLWFDKDDCIDAIITGNGIKWVRYSCISEEDQIEYAETD